VAAEPVPAGGAGPASAVAPTWGVRVTEARAGWPAAAGGLRAGDVVVSVDGTPVASVEEIRATLAGKEAVEITFRNCETGQLEFTRVYP
jgi:S1-C subfamily serine protease